MQWWRELSDEDRYEELARDYYRQKHIDMLLDPFWKRLRAEPPEPISSAEAFYMLELARL